MLGDEGKYYCQFCGHPPRGSSRRTKRFYNAAKVAKTRVEGNVTEAELIALWKAQSGKCALTGMPLSLSNAHLDHIVPVSKGGTSDIDNLRWVDARVNQAKSDMLDDEFFEMCKLVICYDLKRKREIKKLVAAAASSAGGAEDLHSPSRSDILE